MVEESVSRSGSAVPDGRTVGIAIVAVLFFVHVVVQLVFFLVEHFRFRFHSVLELGVSNMICHCHQAWQR